MINIKKLIPILSLSALMLAGCGGDSTAEPADTPIDETAEAVEEPNDAAESDSGTAENVRDTSINFQVSSNYDLMGNYLRYTREQHYETNFDDIQTSDEYMARKSMIDTINEELKTTLSDKLGEEPLIIDRKGKLIGVNKIRQKGALDGNMLVNNSRRENDHVFIIYKHIDDYMNTHYYDDINAEYSNILETLAQYEENIDNATSSREILKTIFENEDVVVMLAPSSTIVQFDENDIEQSIDNVNRFAEYFESDDIQAIFASHFGG